MRPNERGWGGEEGESKRADVLYICTLEGTQEKGGCEEMRGGVERASRCIEFRKERNSGLEAGSLTRLMFQIGARRNNETMMRVEESKERKRAAVFQDTMAIAVADCYFFSQGDLVGGWVKILKWHRSVTHFNEKCWHFSGPENALAPFSGGVSDTRPTKSDHTQNPVGLRFVSSKKTGECGGSDFV